MKNGDDRQDDLAATAELAIGPAGVERLASGDDCYHLRYADIDGIHISRGPRTVMLLPEFTGRIEVRLGTTDLTEPCLLLPGSSCPQLDADYVLMQPGAVREDPRRGWLPLGGVHKASVYLGREDSPALRLGPDVSRDHATITLSGEGISVTDGSRNGTDVVVSEPADVLWMR